MKYRGEMWQSRFSNFISFKITVVRRSIFLCTWPKCWDDLERATMADHVSNIPSRIKNISGTFPRFTYFHGSVQNTLAAHLVHRPWRHGFASPSGSHRLLCPALNVQPATCVNDSSHDNIALNSSVIEHDKIPHIRIPVWSISQSEKVICTGLEFRWNTFTNRENTNYA